MITTKTQRHKVNIANCPLPTADFDRLHEMTNWQSPTGMFTLCLFVLVVIIAHDMRALWLGLVIVVSWSSIGANVIADPEPYNERPASQLYRRYCVSCHGSDGRAKTSKGKFSHARDLSDPQWQSEVSDERIFNSILNGRNVRGNMPPFNAKMNEKEVDSLVDFVRKLKGPQQ